MEKIDIKNQFDKLIDKYYDYTKNELENIVESMQYKISKSNSEKEMAEDFIHLNIATFIMLIK